MSYVHGGTGYVSKTYSSWIDENGNLQYGYIDVAYVMGDSYVVSDELLQLFDANDVRYSAFFARSYQKNYLVSRKYRAAINEAIVETDPITGTPVMPVVEGMDFNEVASIRYAEVVLNKGRGSGFVREMQERWKRCVSFWKHGTRLYRPYLPAGVV